MTGGFKDLQFRGTLWYRAEDVDRKLDSIRNYLNELEETGNFIDKKKIRQLLEAEG